MPKHQAAAPQPAGGKNPEGSSDFTLFVLLNRELAAAIFQLGPDAQVLQPPEWVAEIKEMIRKTLEHYGDASG